MSNNVYSRMNRDFRMHYKQHVKTFEFILKFLNVEEENLVKSIEEALTILDIRFISKIRKSKLSDNPIEFAETAMGTVYTLELHLGIPVSTEEIKQILYESLEIPFRYMRVRTKQDPVNDNEEQYYNREQFVQMTGKYHDDRVKFSSELFKYLETANPSTMKDEEKVQKLYGANNLENIIKHFKSYKNDIEFNNGDKK